MLDFISYMIYILMQVEEVLCSENIYTYIIDYILLLLTHISASQFL